MTYLWCQQLTIRKGKLKRPKGMMILLLPVIAIVFLIGWTMYMIGDEQIEKKKRKVVNLPKKEHVQLIPNLSSGEKEIVAE